MGDFETKEKAQKIYDKTGHKRHYIKSDELISLSDSIISTSNQWGINTISQFIEHKNSMGQDFRIENI